MSLPITRAQWVSTNATIFNAWRDGRVCALINSVPHGCMCERFHKILFRTSQISIASKEKILTVSCTCCTLTAVDFHKWLLSDGDGNLIVFFTIDAPQLISFFAHVVVCYDQVPSYWFLMTSIWLGAVVLWHSNRGVCDFNNANVNNVIMTAGFVMNRIISIKLINEASSMVPSLVDWRPDWGCTQAQDFCFKTYVWWNQQRTFPFKENFDARTTIYSNIDDMLLRNSEYVLQLY